MIAVGLGVVGTLAGTLLGWWLSRKTAREVAREERQWQESQTLQERQEGAVAQLRTAIIDLQQVMPNSVKRPSEVIDDLYASIQQLRAAWTRASLLSSEAIEARVMALDTALFLAVSDAQGASSESVNYYVLQEATIDLRKSLDAFLRREKLPNPEFPTSKEQVRIAGSHDQGLEQIRLHQIKNRRKQAP